MADEKRLRMRIDCDALVTVKVNGNPAIANGKVSNISMAGLFVNSGTVMDVGASCQIDIILLGANNHSRLVMETSGRVVRACEEGVGIEFDQDLEWWPLFAMYSPAIARNEIKAP